MTSPTMKAVVFKSPYKIAVEDRPIPQILEPTDIILRVQYTALCGSELHVFRGTEAAGADFIMGHEFTGTISMAGSAVSSLAVGDVVVSPFTTACGTCFYCIQKVSSRCERGQLFGSEALDGGQAEFVRVPMAETTVVKAPEGVDGPLLCLMADIWPTGYHAAANAFKGKARKGKTVVVLGCGPVGLCAVINAREYRPQSLLAIDSVKSRLDIAESLGAEVWNFETQRDALEERVRYLTEGRGADAVIEVVGSSPALRLAFDLLRPAGVISSVGVHNGAIPWTAQEAYNKNLRVQMGRCPVRSIFPEALAKLQEKKHLLGFMTENIVPLDEAPSFYDLFERNGVQKVIFKV